MVQERLCNMICSHRPSSSLLDINEQWTSSQATSVTTATLQPVEGGLS